MATYWNSNSKQQEIYEQLWNKLVPWKGPAATKAGELLRAATRVYYRWFNDGDRIEQVLSQSAIDSSTVNGWGFLYTYREGEFSGEALALAILSSNSESEYEAKLDEMMDAVVAHAAEAPEVPNDSDFIDEKYLKVYEFEVLPEEDDDYYNDDDEAYEN